MKKLYKHLIWIVPVLIVAAIVTFFIKNNNIKADEYSVDNVYNTIKELSSEKYKGRKIGTQENLNTVKYVEEQFKSMGLKPAGEKNTYLINHEEISGYYDGIAVLELIDPSGKIVKTYRYGEDFREQSYDHSCAGDITSGFKFIKYELGTPLEKAGKSSEIAVAKVNRQDSARLPGILGLLYDAQYKSLINIVSDTTNLKYVSGSIGERLPYKSGYEVPTLTIKERVANEIKPYSEKGYKLHVKSTFNVRYAPAPDVLGMIPGRGSDYLLITAHLDHLGQTSDGTIYPGALDNASGLAAMLEIARSIKGQCKTPVKNIIFIAFNAEEEGLLGSNSYIRKELYPLYKTTVINLDMVGAKKEIPLTFMYSSLNGKEKNVMYDPSSKLRYQMEKLAQAYNIKVNEIDETSGDHTLFNYEGVPAVTLIDYDKTSMHTPDDNIGNIGKENINRILKVTLGFVSMTAFTNISANGYSIVFEELSEFLRVQYPLLIAVFVLSFLFILYYYKEKRNPEKGSSSLPIKSILIFVFIFGLISYFPINYIYSPKNAENALQLLGNGLLSQLKGLLICFLFIVYSLPGFALLYLKERRIVKGASSRRISININMAYYTALIIFIALSFYIPIYYSSKLCLMFTPSFARGMFGKVLTYICLLAIAVIVSKLVYMETKTVSKGYKRFAIFCAVFYMVMSSFYMPISFNKGIISLKNPPSLSLPVANADE